MNKLEETPLKMPHFDSEREEADWWYSQREVIGEQFIAAAETGTLRRGRAAQQIAEIHAKHAARLAQEANTPIELDQSDARQASELAAARGVPYQDFVKKLVHEALKRELSVAG